MVPQSPLPWRDTQRIHLSESNDQGQTQESKRDLGSDERKDFQQEP